MGGAPSSVADDHAAQKKDQNASPTPSPESHGAAPTKEMSGEACPQNIPTSAFTSGSKEGDALNATQIAGDTPGKDNVTPEQPPSKEGLPSEIKAENTLPKKSPPHKDDLENQFDDLKTVSPGGSPKSFKETNSKERVKPHEARVFASTEMMASRERKRQLEKRKSQTPELNEGEDDVKTAVKGGKTGSKHRRKKSKKKKSKRRSKGKKKSKSKTHRKKKRTKRSRRK
uniref:Splicing regulatory glutamine/lysine-rich protein 1 n=1 Tax=Haemonchus contortus TaxID=6289 RepID=A0A7I5EBE7_HAECO